MAHETHETKITPEVLQPKLTIAESIEAAPLFVDDATKAEITELERTAYDNSVPAGDRIMHLKEIMRLKQEGFDHQAAADHAADVIGQPELMPSRDEVVKHVGHVARKTWKVLNTPISQLPRSKSSKSAL